MGGRENRGRKGYERRRYWKRERKGREGGSEKAGSGRNGGKLCNNAYNFAIEKGLKQGSQKKGAGPGMQGSGAGGLDHSIETSFPALSHKTISFQHFTK